MSAFSRFFVFVVGGVLLGGAVFAQAPGMPAPSVGVEIVKAEPVRQWNSFSGRLVAVDFAEIRPQVGGVLQEIRFRNGQRVKKGDILAVIDPRSYQAAEAGAEADYTFAQSERRRVQLLVKKNFVSQSQLEQRTSQEKSALAKLELARLHLDYAYIKAPIDGQVSRAEITVGNLIETNMGAPILTTIAADGDMYADFEVDEQTYLQQVRHADAEGGVPVKVTLRSLEKRVYEGTVEAFDNRINTASGVIRARARIANTDGALLPGMAVTVQVGSPTAAENILLSEQAIGTDQDRKFVLVVDEENKAMYREVTLGASLQGKRVVTKGLVPGDKVITDGLMKVRPEMVVAPKTL